MGVLNDEQLVELVKNEYIKNCNLKEIENCGHEGIDGSSIDLHLSNEIWKLDSTSKLEIGQSVEKNRGKNKSLISIQNGKRINITSILQKGSIYIIKLKEKVIFNRFNARFGLYGRASGKSSIGRTDILTRLIIDFCPKYDEIPPDYFGDLYLEVIPLSFNIKVAEDLSLNQLRIFIGKPDLSRLNERELSQSSPMLYHDRGKPVMSDLDILKVNLEPELTQKIANKSPIAFRSIDTKQILDLSKGHNIHKPSIFWNVEYSEKKQLNLRMKKRLFYILRSYERMLLPNDIAVTCVAYSENLGELRIHYAGFAHPNFGHHKKRNTIGTPLIFETRCHSFDVTLRHEEPFARIEYYKMSEPTDLPSSYSEQELKLSNYFTEWPRTS